MSDSIKLKLKNNLRLSNKKLLKQDITYNFPQLWNKLPITVTNENITNTFKSKLHKYLLDLDWNSLTHPYNIPTATELSKWLTLYFYLILYILLNYKYATTYFYNLYYITTFTTYFLPTLLLLFTSLTRTFIYDIFSLHTIHYTFLPYTQCALHTSLTCNSLLCNFFTHITTIITFIIYLFWKTYYLLY